MSGQVKAYDFRKVVVRVDGAVLTGFWEGDDVITTEDSEDVINTSVGADGKALISISTDSSAVFTFKLQGTGEGNGVMSRIHRAYKQGGAYLFPVSITDIGTGEGVFAGECALMTAASRGHGQSASAREWKVFGGCAIPVDTQYNGI